MTCRRQFERVYTVCEDVVFLTVSYGDGQIGSSVVRLNDTEIGRGPDLTNLPIGLGPSLVGQTLGLKSVVTDVNDMTNRTSVTYTLRCADATERWRFSCTVEQEGDSAIYRGQVTFELPQ